VLSTSKYPSDFNLTNVRRAHTLDSVGILFKEILQYYSRFCPRKTSGTYSRDIAL
jgi:hypothetical protein